LITRRLHLLLLAVTFWITLTVGLGTLAASGHCMITRWSFTPVCGADFVRAIIISPEILIFLFFMITDPRTVPAGRVARVVFGALVAIVSTLLIAPQTTEFGAKVGLLAGLVILSGLRPILDRLLPEAKSDADRLRTFVAQLGRLGAPVATTARRAAAAGLGVVTVLALGAGIVVAGTPARDVTVRPSAEVLNRLPTQVDPATLPVVAVGQDVADFDPELAGPGINDVLVTLAQNLDFESQAVFRGDPSILELVDHGDRLAEMTTLIEQSSQSGQRVLTRYTFDSVSVSLLIPFGRQDGFSLGFASRGTKLDQAYDATGALLSSTSAPYDLVFAVRRATGDRWLLVAVLPPT